MIPFSERVCYPCFSERQLIIKLIPIGTETIPARCPRCGFVISHKQTVEDDLNERSL